MHGGSIKEYNSMPSLINPIHSKGNKVWINTHVFIAFPGHQRKAILESIVALLCQVQVFAMSLWSFGQGMDQLKFKCI